MNKLLRSWRVVFAAVLVSFIGIAFALPQAALAQTTTGTIRGTVTGANGAPLADVTVAAASPSQSARTTTDSHGFFSLVDLTADTYTVSFQKSGYEAVSVPGVTVFQEQAVTVNQQLRPELRTIASVRAAGGSNLVHPDQGTNVYNVTGQQLQAATNPVDTHETLYQYLAVTPGVTGNGFPSQPRIRGGQVTDLGYQFEGIPIQDRIVGFFTTNLANIGLSNIEVYTGGLAGAGAINGTGYFNSVLKTGQYPGYTQLSLQATSPEANQYLTFEESWATPDRRYSAYIGLDAVNSTNQYDYGEYTFQPYMYWGFDNGPGPVYTRDWVGNFHYRPNSKDDFQMVATNSLGEFNFNYLIQKAPGEPPALGFVPCPGAVPGPGSLTGATGGTAPNGAPCTGTGLYWGALTGGSKAPGNFYHHYGGLGKVQWNHNINDHSFFDLRLAENFNQYIFDEPLGEINDPTSENPGGLWNWANYIGESGACPNYPYAVGSPVLPTGDGYDICAWDDGVEDFWGERRSHMWLASGDYQNAINDRVTVKAGISDEYDRNIFHYTLTNTYSVLPNGSLIFPGTYEDASYPTTQQIAYAEGDLRFGKLLVDPGLTYAERHYAFPADQGYATGAGLCPSGRTCSVYSGGSWQHVLNPTFNGTYTFDPSDVIRFSWGDTTNFISSAYVFTGSIAQYTGSGASITRNPFAPGVTFQPQLNHSADFMFEHNFGNNTTLRIGPYYNKTTNYYENFRPFGYFLAPCSGTNLSACTPCTPGTAGCIGVYSKVAILTNNNQHHTLGLEFGLNHIDYSPHGISYWLSGTYDNYWTSAFNIPGAYISSPLPQNIVAQGILVRAPSNPLWSATALADFHYGRFHFDPLLYYQADTFFNTGVTCTNSIGVQYICQNEQIAHGWWWAKLNAYEELGPKRNFILGLRVDNLFDNVTDTAPCLNSDPTFPSTSPIQGTGCWPFDGPFSGVHSTPGQYIYQNYSEGPRTFYFYAGVKM